MNCWRIQNLLAPYLDGVLPEAEHDAFIGHLEDCPECERLTADVAALPSFDGLDVAGPDSEAGLISIVTNTLRLHMNLFFPLRSAKNPKLTISLYYFSTTRGSSRGGIRRLFQAVFSSRH